MAPSPKKRQTLSAKKVAELASPQTPRAPKRRRGTTIANQLGMVVKDRTPTKRKPADPAKDLLNGLAIIKYAEGRNWRFDREKSDEARIRIVERLLAAGMARTDLHTFGERHWAMSSQEMDKMADRVNDRWRLQDEREVPQLRAKYRRTLQAVMQTSLAALAAGGSSAHARNALKCVDQLCRLDGVYEPEKIDISSKVPEAEEVAAALSDALDLMALVKERQGAVDAETIDVTPTNGAAVH